MKLEMLHKHSHESFYNSGKDWFTEKAQLRFFNKHGESKNYFYIGRSPLYKVRDTDLKKL